MAIGIICEYNPFHNGHLHHIKKIKELYNNEEIILVLSGNFTQRGDLSIIEKYDKATIALEYGVDLVVELPFQFVTQSADIFAKGSIEILNHLKCNKIIFGSESNNIEQLKHLAKTQINNKEYETLVKKQLDKGINYPTAMSNALKEITNLTVTTPNDLLGLSYIKEIEKNKYNITPISIQRTNNYHQKELLNEVTSATSIRNGLKENKDITKYVPKKVIHFINNEILEQKYFELLKYRIISEHSNISKYQTVDEGIENRIIKYINKANTLEELVELIKTKRYTHSKIKRMLIHILCSFTKEERKKYNQINYIRILGFNTKGKNYINKIKKDLNIPLITNINKTNISLLELELKCDTIYNLIAKRNDNLYSKKPIIKP
ncbi:MAG: nucleotidyltransferase [Bacilli bacterium]|nr:nucleotidyltransferase [Bacilli bacterium]